MMLGALLSAKPIVNLLRKHETGEPITPTQKLFACYQGFEFGGDAGARTPDPLLAKQVLYQLSYIPMRWIGQS